MSGAAVGVLEQLNRASSAEDFFALLGVEYDPKHVNVVRLHILRRMGQYLVSEDFTGQPDAVVAERCKAVLEQAYADFLASSPLDQRVFKVLKDAVAPPKPPVLIPLTTLK
ncbi:nitrogenase stabilizing/protective protein NifW [Bradyrhizobium sp. AUGA SZCCT0283]|jgi:nitrogenase-stabilizing/protective protein|uniref:nitrogenase stabilizing/protective protein NifW n=1 Tax=Bradyrhizobium sp. AUGA SZCCT0283 TaxID=2807671 RepID=UPI001BAE3DF6|nr:nitrogenase stabilizing/protective protein NifW [Bradyrhizobium sp. AUGA SZCCT0283]MBR1279351.1 nitrogenase stabilizing/protective protein NifW [Bradyrhizobium sp. AUGA SZCCT0283]